MVNPLHQRYQRFFPREKDTKRETIPFLDISLCRLFALMGNQNWRIWVWPKLANPSQLNWDPHPLPMKAGVIPSLKVRCWKVEEKNLGPAKTGTVRMSQTAMSAGVLAVPGKGWISGQRRILRTLANTRERLHIIKAHRTDSQDMR